MTSNCDVTKSEHQIQIMTTICHLMDPPHKNFLRVPLLVFTTLYSLHCIEQNVYVSDPPLSAVVSDHGRHWKDFFQGQANSGFSRGSQNDFCRVGKMAKFRFNHLKLRKQPIFAKSLLGKCQISKFGAIPLPLSDAHAFDSSFLKTFWRCLWLNDANHHEITHIKCNVVHYVYLDDFRLQTSPHFHFW